MTNNGKPAFGARMQHEKPAAQVEAVCRHINGSGYRYQSKACPDCGTQLRASKGRHSK